jgi:thymidylate kinase
MQQLIYLEMPKEEMQARLLKRGENSDRIEDQPETCTKRIQNFFD